MTEPALSTLVRRVFSRAHVRDTNIVVATSGGVDSQVLLHSLVHVRRELNLGIFACGVDHGLRESAGAELELTRQLCKSVSVPFFEEKIMVAPGGNLMARARDDRRAVLLRKAAEVQASYIATGHHLDDRAETVLIRLLRGAPLEGLGVLPPTDGVWIRPLIHATRQAIHRHADRFHLSYADDPTNRNPRFLRSRVRLEVLPLLQQLDPNIAEHLVHLAEQVCQLSERSPHNDIGDLGSPTD